MLAVLILVVSAVVVLVLILLAVIVVAIRQEPRDTEMRRVAPSLIAVMVRQLLGVSLRRPTPRADSILPEQTASGSGQPPRGPR
jgi:hypothetical protein